MGKKKKYGIAVIFGRKDRPRLVIYKSLKHFYAQVINDEAGRTLFSVSTLSPEIKSQIKSTHSFETLKLLGLTIAKKVRDSGIFNIVFDRNGQRYHGKIKAFAEAVREGGLKF